MNTVAASFPWGIAIFCAVLSIFLFFLIVFYLMEKTGREIDNDNDNDNDNENE